MKTGTFTIILVIVFLTTIISGCKKKSEESQVLSNSYSGFMNLEYTRGFPKFTTTVKMNVSLARDGTVTFGPGESKPFDAEEIRPAQGTPEIKMKMTGTLALHEAQGQFFSDKGVATLLVRVHSSIIGQMTVWSWDNDLGWIQVLDTPYRYEDTYNDGQMQFNINDAVFSGSFIRTTIPDIQDTSVYGYGLYLVVALN